MKYDHSRVPSLICFQGIVFYIGNGLRRDNEALFLSHLIGEGKSSRSMHLTRLLRARRLVLDSGHKAQISQVLSAEVA